jgi:hypothetical protein
MDEVREFVSPDISKRNILMNHKSKMHRRNPMHNYNLAAGWKVTKNEEHLQGDPWM